MIAVLAATMILSHAGTADRDYEKALTQKTIGVPVHQHCWVKSRTVIGCKDWVQVGPERYVWKDHVVKFDHHLVVKTGPDQWGNYPQ